MRVVVQRSENASVCVDGKVVGQIDKGLVVLVGFTHNDTIADIEYITKKIANLRIFDDEKSVMNLSVQDVGGAILSISQFTLYANCQNGNRPSYVLALPGDKAIDLYKIFNEKLENFGIIVQTGVFGADMKVSFTNVGPVTIIIDSKEE